MTLSAHSRLAHSSPPLSCTRERNPSLRSPASVATVAASLNVVRMLWWRCWCVAVSSDTVFSFNILSGNIGAAFVIGTTDGRLAVSWDGALDYENIVVYNVTVSVTDNGVVGDTSPLKDTAWVIVTVTNVNDVNVLAFGAYPPPSFP